MLVYMRYDHKQRLTICRVRKDAIKEKRKGQKQFYTFIYCVENKSP